MEVESFSNSECECSPNQKTNSPRFFTPAEQFAENIQDIAETISATVQIAGMHPCKASAAVDVIKTAFEKHELVRLNLEDHETRMRKMDIIRCLEQDCLMGGTEAAFSFFVIKQAFKAYYIGHCEARARDPFMELDSGEIHVWMHAANRVVAYIRKHEGLFVQLENHYEKRIRCLFRQLFQRINNRRKIQVVDNYCKKGDTRNSKCQVYKTMKVDNRFVSVLNETGEAPLLGPRCQKLYELFHEKPLHHKKITKPTKRPPKKSPSTESIHVPRCFKCNSPKVLCDCNIDKNTGNVNEDCSQGPYKCTWTLVTEDTMPPMGIHHHCPVDCETWEPMELTMDPRCMNLCKLGEPKNPENEKEVLPKCIDLDDFNWPTLMPWADLKSCIF